jgi:hypothetical protein
LTPVRECIAGTLWFLKNISRKKHPQRDLSTALPSGRDDNSAAGDKFLPLNLLVAVQEGGVLRVDDAQISGQA